MPYSCTMEKKKLIKTLTDNFDKTQNKLIEQTIKDITNLLTMVEAIGLIKTCNDDKTFCLKVTVESLDESLEYYLKRVIHYCENIKSTVEAIEIATNLLQEVQKNDSKNKSS